MNICGLKKKKTKGSVFLLTRSLSMDVGRWQKHPQQLPEVCFLHLAS